MATNFLQFDTAATNILNDADYNANTQRINGVQTGLAQSALHNKLFYQASTMVSAIGTVLSNAGYTVADNNIANLIITINKAMMGGITQFVAKSTAGSALALADKGSYFVCTSTFTMSFAAAATLGNAWNIWVRNNGTGIITIDPNGAETIDGVTTMKLYPGESVFIGCDGTSFYSEGQNRGRILLATATASNSATIDFLNYINSDFDEYEIEFDSVVAQTDEVYLQGRVGFAGSFQTAGSYSLGFYYGANFGSGTGASDTLTGFTLTNNVGTVQRLGNAAGENCAGMVRLLGPSNASLYKIVEWRVGNLGTTTKTTGNWGIGSYLGATTAIDSFRLAMSLGNIVSGNFRLYGVRK